MAGYATHADAGRTSAPPFLSPTFTFYELPSSLLKSITNSQYVAS